jgi:hypothetical protein
MKNEIGEKRRTEFFDRKKNKISVDYFLFIWPLEEQELTLK